jgi:hypothetical protein
MSLRHRISIITRYHDIIVGQAVSQRGDKEVEHAVGDCGVGLRE